MKPQHHFLALRKFLLAGTLILGSVSTFAQGWIDRDNGRGWGRDRDRGREESIEILYNGYEIRGSGSLYLADQLRRQNPRMDLRSFNTERIILIAKSEQGRGEAVVDFGGMASETRMIDGRPRDFYSMDPRTFYPVDFYNSSRGGGGEPMIHLRGHIMVDRVILIGSMDHYRPEPPMPPPHRPDPRPTISYYEGGSERVQKFVETTKEFRTRQFDEAVFRIRITGLKERVRITRAQVEMQDGYVYDLPELQTVVREGQEIGTFLERSFVRRVIITATSDNLTGSRGEYRLDFGVRQR